MPLEAMQPVGRGEEQGEAAGPAPAASPARTDADATEGVAQA